MYHMRVGGILLVSFVLLAIGQPAAVVGEDGWFAGFGKVDITPTEPVRMSGYGSRDHANTAVDTPLLVRVMALRHGEGEAHLLIAIDTIGLPADMANSLADQVQQRHRIARARVAFCSTHTHCGPDLFGKLANIFSTEATDGEQAAGLRYRNKLVAGVIEAVDVAMKDLSPAKLAHSQGEVDFAANRRLIQNGRWVNFGVQADGPVDHSVPVLRITDEAGKLRGTVFNYACHGTTIGGDHFGINAEWSGYATTRIEAVHPDSVALCTIGCGADANPEPRGSVDLAQLHGMEIADEVVRVLSQTMNEIGHPVSARFGYAGLAFDLPTKEELVDRLDDASPQARRNAKNMIGVLEEHGRLPATYPEPIQVWQFGDELTMIFLGGEVVVDYALRLKKELANPNLWVTAYANDVMGYVASERMRREGGYEYDRSAVYYDLPGPWAAGTEDLLIKRIHEVLAHGPRSAALDPTEALKSIEVADEFEVQLVASEPLVVDPINIAFGPDGKLWVVEMGDYPLGGANSGGRIKFLTDSDGDGEFDTSTIFLDGLEFPTGVHPWNDGVIVSAAPDIFFARDTDGDGRADQRETWYTGFPSANPQHRVNGFAYGLEHSLHCASGDNLGELTAVRTGQTVNASGKDFRIWPATGALDTTSGRTQYIRSRNDWGDWFGNDNSRPMYHYPIEERYLIRNPSVKYSGNVQMMFSPPVAPTVFPRSETADRFNDLYAADRFTSACSSIVFRSSALGSDCRESIFVCEPVHNLVHRSKLQSRGSSYQAARIPSEARAEFLTSTDPSFRPVRVIEGSDAMLWVVDMYRSVIEHPEWIPEQWQQQLDLRGGADRGRIYRVIPKDLEASSRAPASLPRLVNATVAELVDGLRSDSGAKRDLCQQLLLSREDSLSVVSQVQQLVTDADSPQTRVQALWCLEGMQHLSDSILERALKDSHFGVVRSAIALSESRLPHDRAWIERLAPLVDNEDSRVRLQLALTLGQSPDPETGRLLARLIAGVDDDPWLARAILSSASSHSQILFRECLRQLQQKNSAQANRRLIEMMTYLLETAGDNGVDVRADVSEALTDAPPDTMWVVLLATAWSRRNSSHARSSESQVDSLLTNALSRVYQHSMAAAKSDDVGDVDYRCQSLGLFGSGLGEHAEEKTVLVSLLSPRFPVALQIASIENLGRIDGVAAMGPVIEQWSSLSQGVREVVTSEILSAKDGVQVLLSAIENGSIRANDLSAAARQQLMTMGNPSTRTLASRLLGAQLTGGQNEWVAKYLAAEVATADSANGAALFKKHCAVCHLPDDQGRAVGPHLANLSDRSTRGLTESILNPNRAVDPQYRSYVLLTNDDRIITGAIAEELGETVTVVQSDGRRISISRADINSMRNTGLSVMPEGFQSQLDPQALTDVIEYLRSGATR